MQIIKLRVLLASLEARTIVGKKENLGCPGSHGQQWELCDTFQGIEPKNMTGDNVSF